MPKVEASVPKYTIADKAGGVYLRLDQRYDPATGYPRFAIPQIGAHPHRIVPKESQTKQEISAREWFDALPQIYKEQFLSDRDNIYSALGINSLVGLRSTIRDTERRFEMEVRTNRFYANQFNLSGSDQEIADRVGQYSDTADKIIETVARDIFDKPVLFEMTNEVATTRSIVDLLGYAFDTNSDRRMRFEAIRKLTLMGLVASVDQHEREETARRIGLLTMGKTPEEREKVLAMYRLVGAESNFAQLQEFLDSFVFESKISGSASMGVLESTHDAASFATIEVVKLPKKQATIARYRKAKSGHKYTEIGEREFEYEGKHYSVYYRPRKKDDVSTVLKMVRKATTNPGGIQDRIGLLAVLKDRDAIEAFMGKLRKGAKKAGLGFQIDESEDTLDGNAYSAQNPGSSKDLRSFKFIAKVGDLTAEFLLFDHAAYTDNLYRDDVSHEEFAIKRFYETGTPQLLFPESVYEGVDHAKLETTRRQAIRNRMRDR